MATTIENFKCEGEAPQQVDVKVAPCNYRNKYVPRVVLSKNKKLSKKWQLLTNLWNLPDTSGAKDRQVYISSWLDDVRELQDRSSEKNAWVLQASRVSGLSYASVALRNATPTMAFTEIPDHPVELLSKSESELLDTALFKNAQWEMKQARLLCEAIAQRYASKSRQPKKTRVNRETPKPFVWPQASYNPGVPRLPPVTFCYGKFQPSSDDIIVAKIPFKDMKHYKQRQVRKLDYSNVLPEDAVRKPPPPTINRRLRHCLMMEALCNTVIGRAFVEGLTRMRIIRNPHLEELIRPQMDTQGESINIDQRGNTVISEHEVSKSSGPKSEKGFVSESVPRERMTTTTERWIPISTIVWNGSHKFNEIIWSSNQPFDLIKQNFDNISIQPILTHRYIKTGLKFKFQVNSNKFQIGQLIASWIYADDSFSKIDEYLHVGSCIQRNHVKLLAGTSNDGELTVPYHYPRSVMRTNKDDLIMGRLVLQVINPLTVTETVSSSCHITVLACFDNIECYGSIARSIVVNDIEKGEFHRQNDFVTPEMDTVGNLIGVGAQLLNVLGADRNRDNPPINLQPNSLVPQAMSSFCYMKGVGEPVYSMRADPTGQTPHINTQDEMNISNVCRKWGYLKTVAWKVSHGYDTQLITLPVNPLNSMDDYPKISKGGKNLTKTQYTPIAAITSMFGEWRGDLEFKFEIVASSFHTGRLIIGLIPGGQSAEPSINILKSSAYEIFDIGSSVSLEFKAPWYFWNAWGATRTISTAYRGNWFSTLHVKVLVPLIAIDSVPPDVSVNIYVRAGTNFELAIPRQSTLSVPWGKVYNPPSVEYLIPYNKENKVYTTWERNIGAGENSYATTFYVQNVSDGWCGFIGGDMDSYYELTGLSSGRQVRIPTYTKGILTYPIFGIADPDLKNSNAQGLILMRTKEDAVKFIEGYHKGHTLESLRKSYAILWEKDGDWSQVAVDKDSWGLAPNDGDYLLWERRLVTSVRPQMDSVSVEEIANKTQFGLTTFGERLLDLKDLCRRWIPYASISAKSCTHKYPKDCPFTARFAVHPLRILSDVSSAGFDNRAREGVISLIGSAYYLWRGGLRFRFVFSGAPPTGTVLYVQHRFDEDCDFSSSEVQYSGGVTNVEDLMIPSYATSVQCLDVNPSLTVEVPYYSANEGLHCTPNSDEQIYSNGRLYVWVHTPSELKVDLEVYYSFADDCRYSVWQGFPGLYTLSEITNEPVPQMDPGSSGNSNSFPQGFFDFFKPEFFSKVDTAIDKITNISESAQGVIKKTDTAVDKLLEKLNVPRPVFEEKMLQGDYAGVVKDLLTNNFYCLYPSLTHIIYACVVQSKLLVCFAVFNFFQSLFGINVFSFSAISSAISNVWNWCFPSASTQQPQGPMDEAFDCKELVEIVVNTLGTVLGLKLAMDGWDMNSLVKGLFASTLVYRSSYTVSCFVIDLFKLFYRAYQHVLGTVGYNKTDYSFFSGVGDGRLKDWLLQVTVLISPQLRPRCFTDKAFSSRVFTLAIMGRSIMLALSRVDFDIPFRFINELRDKIRDILALEKELLDRKCYAPIRYEPYCLFLAGDGGCGKSTAASMLAGEIAKACGGNFEIYSRTAGNKYFDAYTGQDTILIDDFLTMSPNSDPESYSQFLQMKSSAVFNPPYSNVEDKAKYVNFMNLIVTSNSAFFDNLPGIKNAEAFNRRRDTLVYMELKNKNGKRVTDDYTPEQLSDFEQSNIFIPSDVFNIQHVKDVPLVAANGKTMKQSLVDYVVDQASKYHIRQAKIYKQRVKEYQDACAAKNDGKTIDDILKKYIDELKKLLPETDGWSSKSFQDFDEMFSEWAKASGASAGAEPQMFGFTDEDQERNYRQFWQNYTGKDPASDSNWRKDHRDSSAMSLTYVAQMLDAELKKKDFKDKLDLFNNAFLDPNWTLKGKDTDLPKTEGPWIHNPNYKYSHYKEIIKREGAPLTAAFPGICLHVKDFDIYDMEGQFFYNRYLPPAKSPQSAPSGKCVIYHRQSDGSFKMEIDETCQVEEMTSRYVFDNWADIRVDLLKTINGTNGKDEILKKYPPSFYGVLLHMILIEEKFGTFKKQFREFSGFGKRKFNPSEEYQEPTFETECKRRRKSIEDWFRLFASKLATGVRWVLGFPVRLAKLCRISKLFSDPKSMSLKDIAILITPFVLIGVVVKGLLNFSSVLSSIKGMFGANITPNLHMSGDFKDIKKHSSVRDKALTLMSVGNAVADVSPIESSSFDDIKKKIKRNIIFITGINQGRVHEVRCLGLVEHKFLVLRHYIEFFKSQNISEIIVYTPDKKLAYNCKLEDLEFSWTNEGYGVGIFPKSFPRMFVNIVKYMPSENFDGLYPRQMEILEVTKSDERSVLVEADPIEDKIDVFGDATMSSWTITKGFQYSWGGRGRCGSLLLCPGLACPLVGIHTSGNGNWKGFSEKLLKETFSPIISSIEYQECVNDEQPKTELKGNYDVIGKVEPEMRLFNTTESRIVPSSIHGVFEVKSEPAPLSKFDDRIQGDPLLEGVNKRTLNTSDLPEKYVSMATQDLVDKLNINNIPIRKPGVLSYAHAIEGSTIIGYKHIEFSTSEGYPWVKLRPSDASGKRWLFDLDETSNGYKVKGIHKDLYAVLEYKNNLRKQRIQPRTYFSPQLKDARILKEKVHILGKTRVFEMSPIELTIAQRQYFLDFSASYSANRLQCENTLGINPDGYEWTELANKLLKFSSNILSADYSGYGPTLPLQILERAIYVIRQWYLKHGGTKEEDSIREMLGEEIMHGIHIVNDLYFTPSCGLPSGNCDTTTLNSLSNSILIRTIYLVLAHDNAPDLESMTSFNLYVLLFHNGDDLIISVKDEIIEWFNNRTLIEAFSKFGIKMTDSRKRGEVRDFDNLLDVSYLKRGFSFHPVRKGQYLAPLELASITDTANWCHKSLDLDKESLINSEMSCRLAYTHGPEIYTNVAKKISEAWKLKNKRFLFPLWSQLDSQVWDNKTEAKFYY